MTLSNGRIEGIYNWMEEQVWEALQRLFPSHPNVCHCSLCEQDMSAYALNRLPASYVSTQEGEARLTSQELDQQVIKIVEAAIHHVSHHPHRPSRTMTEYTMNELFAGLDKE